MRMTTRGRYGLRAMLELARHHGEGPVLMNDLAARERLSVKYLHRLLTSLRSAGLVESVRGAGGGFRLSRPPSRIRLNEVLEALEGPLSIVECVGRPQVCRQSKLCTARQIWDEVSRAVDRTLHGFTLASLLRFETRQSCPPSKPRRRAAGRPTASTRGRGGGKSRRTPETARNKR